MRKTLFIIFSLLIIGLAGGASFALPDMSPAPEAASSTIRFEAKNDSVDVDVDEAIENSTNEVVTPHVEDIKVMNPNSNEEVKKIVLKDTNESLKFTINKFLGAMAGVAISSILIFLILLVMNKFNIAAASRGMGFPGEPNDEASPFKNDNIPSSGENEALRIFLEKTK